MSKQTVELVHYWHGPEGAPVMVMLHGMGLESLHTSWDPVVPLLDDDYRILTMDLRGHGESPLTETYRMEDFAADVAALMDDEGVPSGIIVGHSMGGIVALNLALLRPDLIDALVIEDAPPPRWDSDESAPPPVRTPPRPYDMQQGPKILAELGKRYPEWAERLEEITAPTLVMGGGWSGGINQDRLRRLAEDMPNADFITIDVGHNIHPTHPEEFVGAMRTWLREVLPLDESA